MHLLPDPPLAPYCTPAVICSDTHTLPLSLPATRAALRLEIVSDVICPWCYIAKRQLALALAQLGQDLQVELVWRPFQLNPTLPPEGIARAEYLAQKFGSLAHAEARYAPISAAAARCGLPFNPARITRVPNTFDAHRLIAYSARYKAQGTFVAALFNAYFVDGRDLGQREVLVELAQGAGLDGEKVRIFLAGSDGENEVRAAEAAAHRLSISSVPAFVIDGQYLFSGAQDPGTLVPLLRNLHARFGTTVLR